MATLEENLKQLGLINSEIVVFLKLAQIGKASAVQIAHATDINRTTVYSILKQLVKRNLVIEDVGQTVREFQISPVTNINHLLEAEEKLLEEKKKIAQDTMRTLGEMTKQAKYTIPKIQFITEEKIESFLYQQSSKWSQSMKERDGYYWGFQDKDLVGIYDVWIDWYWNQDFSKTITLQLLSNHSEEEKKVAAKGYERRHVVFWKETVLFTSTLWVMGDFVVMIVLSQSPHYLVEIHDATLAYNLKETFKAIWEDLKKEKI